MENQTKRTDDKLRIDVSLDDLKKLITMIEDGTVLSIDLEVVLENG